MFERNRLLREGLWLTPKRLQTFGLSLLTFEIVMFAFFVAGTHGLIVPLSGPVSTDFVSFYGAGTLANTGNAYLAYDPAAHHAAEQHATEPGIPYNYFYYPPVFLLICMFLARLPYLPAFVAFQAVTIGPCLLAVKTILPKARNISLLAFPSVFWTLGTGQNAFLSAALFAAGTVLLVRRPWVAGLAFGALCFKPHFGLLIPVALVAGGHWRTFAGAAVGAAVLVALSAVAFGWETWWAFLIAAARSDAVYATRSIDLAGLASPFGATMVLGGGRSVAYAVQGAVSVAVAAGVGIVWHRWAGASLPVRAAILIAGTPLAVPVVMFYDLMLCGIAMAWLVRAGQANGFPPWHKTALAVLFLMPLLSGNLDGDSKLLIAPLTAIGCFALTISQARHEWRGRRQAAPALNPSGAP